MAVTPDILEEYSRVGSEFSAQHPNTDFERFLALVVGISVLVSDVHASSQICVDSDDDKFIHCALAAGATHIVSGDKHLLDISPYQKIEVVKPRQFVDKHLSKAESS